MDSIVDRASSLAWFLFRVFLITMLIGFVAGLFFWVTMFTFSSLDTSLSAKVAPPPPTIIILPAPRDNFRCT